MDVAVLGAGSLGRAVARVCAVAGHDVHLYDEDVDAVMDAIDAVEAAEGTPAGDRVDGTTGLDGAVTDADVVVGTAFEDRASAQELVADVETRVDDDTLVATSSGRLSVTGVAAGLRDPGRAVGLQFVDPPAAPLVEVVLADQTTAATRDRARSFVEGLDREAVVVFDAPGFATTRLTLALTAEAMRMVDRGVAGVRAVDRAMERGHGHPVGPLAAADRAGLDARLAELEHLSDTLGDRFDPPAVLEEKVEAGELGRSTGTGFYEWEGGERGDPAEPDPTADLPETRPSDPGVD